MIETYKERWPQKHWVAIKTGETASNISSEIMVRTSWAGITNICSVMLFCCWVSRFRRDCCFKSNVFCDCKQSIDSTVGGPPNTPCERSMPDYDFAHCQGSLTCCGISSYLFHNTSSACAYECLIREVSRSHFVLREGSAYIYTNIY